MHNAFLYAMSELLCEVHFAFSVFIDWARTPQQKIAAEYSEGAREKTKKKELIIILDA